MKKLLIVSAALVYSMVTFADCEQNIKIINITGSATQPGIPLRIQIKLGNVKWNPDLTGTVLDQFNLASSIISYESEKAVTTTIYIYDENNYSVCSAEAHFVNKCEINWNYGCTSPFRQVISHDSNTWTFKYYNN